MKKEDYYRFRLTTGKTQGTYQLPLKTTFIEKKDEKGKNLGLKKVQYIKGSDSIFVEDHTGDQKPKTIWFEDGVLDVHKQDKALVAIVFGHRWYGTRYELVDEVKEAEKKLSNFDLIDEANAKLLTANEDELRAIGLAVLGGHTLSLPIAVIKKSLKEKAYGEPQSLIDEMSSGDYRAKYAASLALLKGVILINPTNTAVTWPDGQTIVQVPAGQDPLTKIGLFLSQKDESARVTLQEIGERTTRAYNKKTVPDVSGAIAKINADPVPANPIPIQETTPDPIEPVVPQTNPIELVNADDDTDDDKMTLEEATSLYLELYDDKDKVPPNKKNDLDWILQKIEEAKATD